MIEVLKTYVKDGKNITEYTKDGVSISHVVEELITEDIDLANDSSESSAEDMQSQILLNTEYLVAMSELTNI